MITFEHQDLKTMMIKLNGVELITIPLQSSTITNRFFIVENFIHRMSESFCSEFDEWFEYFIITYYYNHEKRFQILMDNIPEIKDFVDRYFEFSGVNFQSFLDESKAKKNTILFNPDEIEQIAKNSCYLKIYSIISNSETLKLDQRLHKRVYNEFLKDISSTDITLKIYNIVKTKTYKYNFTDKYMWSYIQTVQNKTIEMHVIQIFNFIMNSILILCEENRNPIIYFSTVIDESIKWILRSVYKTSVIYEDSIATENIQSMNINNLKTFSYNDTLGRLKSIAYERLHKKVGDLNNIMFKDDTKNEKGELVELQNRIQSIEHISPLCDNFVYPIFSKATKIPYKHFKTLTPEHASILSTLAHDLFKTAFKQEFKHTIELLNYYPINAPPIATTYKIKSWNDLFEYQNKCKSFYGFNTRISPANIISNFIGRIIRITFVKVEDGSRLSSSSHIPKIENELMKFYTYMFANKLDFYINKIHDMINEII